MKCLQRINEKLDCVNAKKQKRWQMFKCMQCDFFVS